MQLFEPMLVAVETSPRHPSKAPPEADSHADSTYMKSWEALQAGHWLRLSTCSLIEAGGQVMCFTNVKA